MAVQRLPLTAIELYHLADDSPRYPNVIGCDLVVSGVLDRDVATRALRKAADSHRMMAARLQPRGIRRPFWKLANEQAEQLVWQAWPEDTDGQPDQPFMLPRIDPQQQITAQYFIQQQGQQTRFGFRSHHAAVDGVGGLQFVQDFLIHYHQLANQVEQPRPRRVDSDLLPKRNHLKLFSREFAGKLWIQPVAVLGALKFLLRRVTRMVPNAGHRPVSGPAPTRLISATIPQSRVARLKQTATAHGATVNDLLLAAVFLSIHQTRKRRNWAVADEWLRLVIPFNIRDVADRRLPAANRATIVQLDRRDRDFADPAGLIWGINHELGNIRGWNLEKTFLLVLKWMSLVPGWISRVAGRPVCRATTVLTNLGAPLERLKLKLPVDEEGRLRAGDLTVEDLQLAVPLRWQTPLVFAACRYRDRQSLNLHFDCEAVPPDLADELLKRVLDSLEQLSGLPAPHREAGVQSG